MIRSSEKFTRNSSFGWISIGLILFSWYAISTAGRVKAIFLPSPFATGSALWELIASGLFFRALAISFARIASATIIAVLIGGAVGIWMGISKRVEGFCNPIIQPLRYLPITALIPLLVLWFGIGETMKIVFLTFGIVFYFIPLVRNAIRETPREYKDVARSFGADKKTIVKLVYFRYALPQIFDGLIIINGLGWNYVVLAEIINAREGLGYLINIAGRLQRSDEVFAGLILIALVAMGSDHILQWIRKKYYFW